MRNNISTIAEIEAEQQQLKIAMQLTRKEFSRSMDANQSLLKSYVLKKIVLPVGAVGLGAVAANKVFNSKKNDYETKKSESEANIFGQILPFILTLVQTFLLKKQSEEMSEINQSNKTSEESIEDVVYA